jgi:hypothetical protein
MFVACIIDAEILKILKNIIRNIIWLWPRVSSDAIHCEFKNEVQRLES